jgi:PAS domain S-box-containing protein/putative nucleotidyltransferase with HDIG domain
MAVSRSPSFSPLRSWVKPLIAAVAITVYIFLFMWLFPTRGLAMGALATLPVMTVAWFWGTRAGLTAVLLSLPVNTLLFNLAGAHPGGWNVILASGGGVGTVSLLLVGIVVGRLRDLETRVRQRTNELERANSGLREAEVKYRALVEQLPAAIYIDVVSPTNPINYRAVYASPYFQTLLGYSAEEIIAQPDLWASLIHPDDLEQVLDTTLHFYSTGERLSHEYRMRTRDGRLIWVNDETVLLPSTSSNQKYFQGVMFDITEIKQSQETVMQSERRFRALIENSTDAISLLGTSGRLEYASPSTRRILGYSSDEAIGVDPATLTHPDDLQILLPLLADLMQKPGATVTAQYRFRHKDGSWRWVEAFISNLLIDPAVNAIVFNYRDITERKAHERELQALVSVSAALRTITARGEIAPIILDQLIDFLNAQGAALEMLVPVTNDLVVELGRGVWAPLTGVIIPHGREISDQGLPYLNNDAARDPNLFRPDLLGTCTAIAGAPLLANKQIVGILWICTERPLNEHDLRLLVAVADTAANAIQRESMHENAARQLERLAALRDIDQAITSSTELRLTINIILAQTKRQLNVDAVSILLLNKHLHTLEFAAGQGFRTTSFEKVSPVRLGEGYAGRAALERRSIYVADLQKQQDNPLIAKNLTGDHFVSYYAIPLIAKGQVIGVMEVFQRTPLNPDPDWLSFFEALAGQTAIAVDSAQLFEGLQRSNVELSLAYDATIEGWSRAMDLRDKETEGHTLRVTDLTLKLAAAVGMRSEELVHIRRGALLHDIGKMGVPDNILLKPDKLTDEEWVSMRKHPEYAYEMLLPINYLRPALDIPYCHHEKWDGTGYPRGLKGLEIPQSARIFAVADVWDALRSDRPYRQGWSEGRVREHIQTLSGTHFDPEAVAVFMQIAYA